MVEFSLESRSDHRRSRTLFFSIELFSDEQVVNFLLYGSEHNTLYLVKTQIFQAKQLNFLKVH